MRTLIFKNKIIVIILLLFFSVNVLAFELHQPIEIDFSNADMNFWDGYDLTFTDSTGTKEYSHFQKDNNIWVEVTESLTVTEPVTAYMYYGERKGFWTAYELSFIIVAFGIFIYLILKGMENQTNIYDYRVEKLKQKGRKK